MPLRAFIESLIKEPRKAKYSFRVVDADRPFQFRNLCPYCSGHLTYTVTGWEQDETGLWIADSVDSECWNEPDIELYPDAWEHWLNTHYEMPYSYQMPVDEKVKRWINAKHRFYFKEPF